MKTLYISKKCILVILIVAILTEIILLTQLEKNTVEVFQNNYKSLDLMNQINNTYENSEKIAYLTFDDGPTTIATPTILDILKEENVKATFFVIGKSVNKNPEIVKRAYNEGHYIANHGYDHNNSTLYKSNESFKDELEKTDQAIGNAIGINNYNSHIFRFPNGFMAPANKKRKEEVLEVLREMNYKYIDWNCLNNDSMKKYSKIELLNNLKKTSQNKNKLVILMHDTKDVSDSSSVLKESIEYLKSEGYNFKSFYDL